MGILTIQTYLRPAKLTDVFENEDKGLAFEDKQFFYKSADNTLYGPHRLVNAFNEKLFSTWYLEVLQLLNDERMFVVDPLEYSESIPIELPLQRVTEDAILQNNHLIVNTLYYLKMGASVDGPFYINKTTTKEDLKNRAKGKQTYVLDKPKTIKVVEALEMVG